MDHPTEEAGAAVALRPPDVDRPLDYRNPWGQRPPGRCRLRVWHPERVALVTELDDNPGPSVTNSAEVIAEEVRAMFDGYTLVEHYDASLSRGHSLAVVHHQPGSVATWSPLPAGLDWLADAVTVG